MCVPFGLFLVTSVTPEVRFPVVHVTVELQTELLAVIVQEVEDIVPEGTCVLFSEQDALEPPNKPLQFQVQTLLSPPLLALVPALQL